MKKLLIVALLSASSFGAPVLAQEEAKSKKEFSPAQLAQQQKMKDCNAEAKTKALAGDERKAFMKECLSGSDGPNDDPAPSEAGGPSQQEKMKTCNAEAKSKDLKGDARKDFMKTCLSGS